MNWLFIIIVAILLISALKGYHNGLIKTMFSLVSIVLAIIVTSIVSPLVSDALQKDTKVHDMISTRIEKAIEVKEDTKKTSEETKIIEELSIPESIKELLIENNNKSVYKALAVNSFHDYVNGVLTIIIINALSYVGCFIIIMIALFVLSRVLDLISKLPLLNELNKSTGMLAGLVGGCVKVWIFFIIITAFSTTELGVQVFEMIDKSQLLTFIYDNNLLMNVITNISKSIF